MEHVTRNGDVQIIYEIVVDNSEGERPFGRPGKYRIIMLKMVQYNQAEYDSTCPYQGPVPGS
jgi:hypothetical protein